MIIKVEWEVEDAYAGKSRPQKTIFDTDHYMDYDEWYNLSEEEKFNLIDEAVQEDFNTRISYSINNWSSNL